MAIKWLDLINGNNSNSGTAWNDAKLNWSNATALLSNGDELRVIETPSVSLSVTASLTNLSRTVTLSSAVTKTIDACDSAWTAATNVTASTTATCKEGSAACTFAIAAAFTTGTIGYKAMSSTDFSSYRRITFWLMSTATTASGVYRINLCSDNAGATPVNQVTINQPLQANTWAPIVVDSGGALGASIQSVSIEALSDPGAVTVTLDHVEAALAVSNADALSLQSIIQFGSDPRWYLIRSIKSTTLMLDADLSTTVSQGRGYYGTTASGVAIKRIDPFLANATQTATAAGISGSRKKISGGWSSVNGASQTGWTAVHSAPDGSGAIRQLLVNGGFCDTEGLIGVRGSSPLIVAGTSSKVVGIGVHGLGGSTQNLQFNGTTTTIEGPCYGNHSITGVGITFNGQTGPAYVDPTLGLLDGSNSTTGIQLANSASGGANLYAYNCVTGITTGNHTCDYSHIRISDCTTGLSNSSSSNNEYTDVLIENCTTGVSAAGGNVRLHNAAIKTCTNWGAITSSGGQIYCDGLDTTGSGALTTSLVASRGALAGIRNWSTPESGHGAHSRIMNGAYCTWLQDSTRRIASGYGLKTVITSSAWSSVYPFRQVIGKSIFVPAGKALTITGYFARNSTSIVPAMVVRGGKWAGISTDQVGAYSGASDGSYSAITLTLPAVTYDSNIEVEWVSYVTATGPFIAYWQGFDQPTIA